jgi:hypothetical protein
MALRKFDGEQPKIVYTVPYNPLVHTPDICTEPLESFSIIMRGAMMLSFVAFLAAVVGILQSPISRDYYLGEIPHCFTDKCMTGPGAEKRLDALGVKYKNSPKDYANYKMWKFQEVEAKKPKPPKPRWMTD